MEIDEDKVLYDLSDHVYIFMELIVREDRPRYRGARLEEVKYFKVKDEKLMREYIGELERRVRVEREGSVSVEAYDDMIGDSAERVLQGTFRRRVREGRGGGGMVDDEGN